MTVSELDIEIKELTGIIASLESRRNEAIKVLAEAQEERHQIAFEASTTPDPRLKQSLQKARQRAATAQLEAEDLESALSQAKEKLADLRYEREDAQRQEYWADALKLAEKCQGEAEQIDKLIADFVSQLSTHRDNLKQLGTLAYDSGREYAFQSASLRHVLEVLRAKLFELDPSSGSRGHDCYRQGYASVFASQVNNATRNREAA